MMRKHLGRPVPSDKLDEDEVLLVTEYRRALRAAPHRAQDIVQRVRAFADACERWKTKTEEGEALITRALAGQSADDSDPPPTPSGHISRKMP